MTFTIRPVGADDWREYRALRLEMLQDSPKAFLERLSDAKRRSDAQWRERAVRSVSASGIRYVAITGEGVWVGMMGAVVPNGGTEPIVVSVYVTPKYRGGSAGVTDALLEHVEAWALERSDSAILHVHEHNARAIAAYEKRGYTLTGATLPYPLASGERELEMRKQLA